MSTVLISMSSNPTQTMVSILKHQEFSKTGFVFMLLCAPHSCCCGFIQGLGSSQCSCLLFLTWASIPGSSLGQSKGACSLQTSMCSVETTVELQEGSNISASDSRNTAGRDRRRPIWVPLHKGFHPFRGSHSSVLDPKALSPELTLKGRVLT